MCLFAELANAHQDVLILHIFVEPKLLVDTKYETLFFLTRFIQTLAYFFKVSEDGPVSNRIFHSVFGLAGFFFYFRPITGRISVGKIVKSKGIQRVSCSKVIPRRKW